MRKAKNIMGKNAIRILAAAVILWGCSQPSAQVQGLDAGRRSLGGSAVVVPGTNTVALSQAVAISDGVNVAKVDDAGNLQVNSGVTIVLGADASIVFNGIDPTNVGQGDAAIPARAGLIGFARADGTLVAPSAANPLPITGVVTSSTPPSVGDAGLTSTGQVDYVSMNSPLPAGTNPLGSMVCNAGTGTQGVVEVPQGGASNAASVYSATTLTANVKGSAGQLYALMVTSRDTSSPIYLAVDNTTGLPDGAAPSTVKFPCPPAPTSGPAICVYDQMFRPNGWYFSSGISVCVSSSPTTCTAAGLDAGLYDIQMGYQ